METSNLVGGFDSNKGKQHTWRSLKQDPFSQIGNEHEAYLNIIALRVIYHLEVR